MTRLQTLLIILASILCSPLCYGQYEFSGVVDHEKWQSGLYLSLVDDYRKLSGVHPEQVINKVQPDATGYFSFQGNNLSSTNNVYRIHVDNCTEENQTTTHYTGHCLNSKEILFIANNSDQIQLPFSFDEEMFCRITSNNEKADAFIKLDSLKEQMAYDFGTFRSTANRQLNAQKWFSTFQEFGQQLKEPLAELYAFAFFSDRSSDLYTHYLKDLESNAYYDKLLGRLENSYPQHPFTQQYKNELNADRYVISQSEGASSAWYFLLALLIISILVNGYFVYARKQKNKNEAPPVQLTTQEQKIVDLILKDHTNKEVASAMFVSLSTVKTHINNIYRKLDVSSRDTLKSLYNK
jgi:DNA-binding CsgD family transcriptional regulator